MRLLIAAGALTLLATPALAQRLDTRRVNIRDTGSTKVCDFNAYPITLIDGGKSGAGSIATWRQPPQDAKPDDPDRFEFVFDATPDWRKPASIGIGARIRPDDEVNTDTVGSARFLFDGLPAKTSYSASTDKLIFAIGPDLDAWAAKLVETSTLDLEILNKDGRMIRRYWWDVRHLGEGLETVSVVKWTCGGP